MDCATSLSQIISSCQNKEITCLAIADHGTIEGAVKLKDIAPFTVIVAEEILTDMGEIMGMFLSESIPGKLSVIDTIKRIRDQGGLVCIPHPGDLLRSSAFNINNMLEIIDQVDIIEVFNARNCLNHVNRRAQNIAIKYNKLNSAGSDAHVIAEIGNAYIEMPEFFTKEEFLISLGEGKVRGKLTNPLVHILSTRNRLLKRFTA